MGFKREKGREFCAALAGIAGHMEGWISKLRLYLESPLDKSILKMLEENDDCLKRLNYSARLFSSAFQIAMTPNAGDAWLDSNQDSIPTTVDVSYFYESKGSSDFTSQQIERTAIAFFAFLSVDPNDEKTPLVTISYQPNDRSTKVESMNYDQAIEANRELKSSHPVIRLDGIEHLIAVQSSKLIPALYDVLMWRLVDAPEDIENQLNALKTEIFALRECIKNRPFLDLEYDKGLLNRLGFEMDIELKGKSRIFFELVYEAKGNPIGPEQIECFLYPDGDLPEDGIRKPRHYLNTQIEKLGINVDKTNCLKNKE